MWGSLSPSHPNVLGSHKINEECRYKKNLPFIWIWQVFFMIFWIFPVDIRRHCRSFVNKLSADDSLQRITQLMVQFISFVVQRSLEVSSCKFLSCDPIFLPSFYYVSRSFRSKKLDRRSACLLLHRSWNHKTKFSYASHFQHI